MTRPTRRQRQQLDPQRLAEARETAVAAMRPATRQQYEELQSLIADDEANTVRYYYHIGETLKRISMDPIAHGDNAITLLEQALTIHKRLLQDALRFATRYSEQEVEEILAMRNDAVGFRILFAHIRCLLAIRDATQRRALLLRAFEALWDPAQLRQEVKTVLGTPNPHGRPVQRPATPSQQIRRVLNGCQRWLTQYKQWAGEENQDDPGGFQWVLGSASDVFTEEDLTAAREVEEAMRAIREASISSLPTVRRLVEHLEFCLAAQAAVSQEAREREETTQATGGVRRCVDLGDLSTEDEPGSDEPRDPRNRVAAAAAAARQPA